MATYFTRTFSEMIQFSPRMFHLLLEQYFNNSDNTYMEIQKRPLFKVFDLTIIASKCIFYLYNGSINNYKNRGDTVVYL